MEMAQVYIETMAEMHPVVVIERAEKYGWRTHDVPTRLMEELEAARRALEHAEAAILAHVGIDPEEVIDN